MQPVTEVTVQLPASICRPIHGTRSAGPLVLHQSQSLTLNEFHELLLGIQREMMAQQRAEHREQQRHHQQQQGQQQQQIGLICWGNEFFACFSGSRTAIFADCTSGIASSTAALIA